MVPVHLKDTMPKLQTMSNKFPKCAMSRIESVKEKKCRKRFELTTLVTKHQLATLDFEPSLISARNHKLTNAATYHAPQRTRYY